MENLVFRRITTGITAALGVMGAICAFFFLKFPYSFIFGGLAGGAALVIWYFNNKAEKKARLDAFYQVANQFGRPVSFENLSASFERDGINFDVEFPRDEHSNWFKVSFYVPKVYQSFIIQHNALFKESLPHCFSVENSPLTGMIFLHADNQEFLLDMLKKREITDEIYNYPPRSFARFSIVFDEGNFEMRWTPPAGEQIDGLYQVCQTASVFYDELKKHAKTS